MTDPSRPADRIDAARLLTDPRVRLVVLVVSLAAVAFTVGRTTDVSIDGLRGVIDDAGWAGPLLFVLLYIVFTVLIMPAWVASAASGVLFGTFLGTGLTVVGATIGATLSFLIGRRLGRSSVEQLTGGRVEKLDRWISRRGLVAVLYVRLIPVFPFSLVNYAAGLTGARFRDYVVGTAVGIVPGSFAYAALGGNLDDPTSPAFLGAVALVLGLLVAGPFLARRFEQGDEAGSVDAVADRPRDRQRSDAP